MKLMEIKRREFQFLRSIMTTKSVPKFTTFTRKRSRKFTPDF